jgi:hypothetical protein
MSVRYFEHKDLRKCIMRMSRSGGKSGKASDQVHVIRSKIMDGDPKPFQGVPLTKHGENRIKNCRKYDLPGFARLVTIRKKNLVCLRYVGSHDEVDKWLDRNRGLTLVVSNDNDLVEINISDNAKEPTARISYIPDNYVGRILDRLDHKFRTRFIGDLPSKWTEQIRDLQEDASDDEILHSLSSIEDEEQKNLIFDVLVLLSSGDTLGAENRIRFNQPESEEDKLVPVEEVSEDQILKIRDGETMRSIQIGSEQYEEWVKAYLTTATDLDWFLFMHPEQEKFVNADYSGPAKLSGVSGSGKTCIAVRRAVRLAVKYSSEDIALVTLNRSLSSLISGLVDHTCLDPEIRQRIKVYSLFELCQELLRKFEPENEKLYFDVTLGLEEHIDEVFREFYRCQLGYSKAVVLRPLHQALSALAIDAETYVREEFDWIRSAVQANAREQYLDIERSGRGYRIDKTRRHPILEGLGFWEEKMRDIGAVDYLGLTAALSKHRDKIFPQFRSVLVDEAQDFGTTELDLLRKLVPSDENDFFLFGDLAQHILPKHQNFSAAGIEVTGRSHTIRRNYRNSREILRAAYEVLFQNLEEALLAGGEMEILDPEFAHRSSAAPVVLTAKSLEDEIACARSLMADNDEIYAQSNSDRPHRGCIVIAGYSLFEISVFGNRLNIPVLDGSRDVVGSNLFLSDLEQTKGYEFDTVAILNCTDQVLPPSGAPPDETFRFGCQLYVAMTRARDQLVLSHSSIPSKWLDVPDGILTFDDWDSFVDVADINLSGEPGYLAEIPDSDDDSKALMELTGEGFNYTMYARGLTGEIQDKLEELVTGRSHRRGKFRVQWENVGVLYNDMRYAREEGRMGHIFGPSADKAVLGALERAHSGDRPIARHEVKKKRAKLKPLPEIKVATNKVYYDPGKLATPIKNLNVTSETKSALRAQGLRTFGDVLKTPVLKLRRSPFFGAGRIDEIRAALKEHDFEW